MFVCICVYVCVRVCVRACMHVHVCVCVCLIKFNATFNMSVNRDGANFNEALPHWNAISQALDDTPQPITFYSWQWVNQQYFLGLTL